MNEISYAMKYAKSHIAMYEDYECSTFDIEEHEQAMDCWNCQSFVQLGIEACEWLIETDTVLQNCIVTGQIEYSRKRELALQELFRRWLKPCEFANRWIDEQYKRGHVIENLDEFRKCQREMKAIVSSFDSENVLPEKLQQLRDEALREHESGETAEFV